MPRSAPLKESFTSGELSPRMAGRASTPVYSAGCHVMENFIPDIAGPAVKCGGTAFVAEVKDSADRTWLVRFDRGASDAFILEFGDNYVRFFKNYEPIMSGGSPYEVVTPYSAAELENADGGFSISFVQSGDILYLAHPNYYPRKLSRFADDNWTISVYEPFGGPFQDLNDTSTTVYASGNTGSITLHASSGIFTSTMLESFVYLEQKSVNGVAQWESGKAIGTIGDKRRNGGRNYSALTTGTTGTVTPTHTEGAVLDGDTGVQWQFLDAGYGWVKITGYTSATQVSATVISRIPDGAVGSGNASDKWALGAWSFDEGYPDSVAFYLDRLVWAKNGRVWMSVAGDYENFKPREADRQLTDSAITLPIPSRKGSNIIWLETLEMGLLVGTQSDEWLVSPASRNEPLGPLNVAATPAGAIGSRAVPPLKVFDSIVFSQRSGKKLRALRYVQGEGANYNDLSVFSDHMNKDLESVAYVAEPYSIIWAAGAGNLRGCAYYPEQEVLGWFKRSIQNGYVECVQSLPATSGDRDDLWMIVRRTIDGSTKRFIEWMKPPLSDDDEQENAHYVDCGLNFTYGSATTSVTGLGHLEGETVAVLADGAVHPSRVVAGGSITLQLAASVVTVGLPFTAKLATMDLESGSATGTAQGKIKRIYRMGIRLLRTVGGKLGTTETKVNNIQFRDPSTPMDAPPPLFTGDKMVAVPGGWDKNTRAWFVHDDPTPATVVAFMPQMTTEDA